MGFADIADWMRRRPARRHTTVELPDPEQTGADTGYFQIRLSSMYLRDERRWFDEIVPATFLLADFDYNRATVRKPFFASNQLLSMLPNNIDPRTLPVDFRDTLVVGPTPYAGGDVGLFVGLFQVSIKDWRKAMFSVFETLAGSIDLGAVSQYARLADKLSDEIMRCLGDEDVKCLLAERRVIGAHVKPRPGYLALFRQPDGPVDTTGLVVNDGKLARQRDVRLVPVEELDYCLIRIDHLARRNDYTRMDFNATWDKASQLRREGQSADAQALMLHCANQIAASPDLTEEHKIALIELYQSKLLAIGSLRGSDQRGKATRSGSQNEAAKMQERADKADSPTRKLFSGSYGRIVDLAREFGNAPEPAGPIEESEVAAHLERFRKPEKTQAATVVSALAAGSLASDAS